MMTEQYEEIAEMFRSVGRSYSHKDIETRMGQLYDPDRLLALLAERDAEIEGHKFSMTATLTKCATFDRQATKAKEAAEQKVAAMREGLTGCLNLPYEERKALIDLTLAVIKEVK